MKIQGQYKVNFAFVEATCEKYKRIKVMQELGLRLERLEPRPSLKSH